MLNSVPRFQPLEHTSDTVPRQDVLAAKRDAFECQKVAKQMDNQWKHAIPVSGGKIAQRAMMHEEQLRRIEWSWKDDLSRAVKQFQRQLDRCCNSSSTDKSERDNTSSNWVDEKFASPLDQENHASKWRPFGKVLGAILGVGDEAKANEGEKGQGQGQGQAEQDHLAPKLSRKQKKSLKAQVSIQVKESKDAYRVSVQMSDHHDNSRIWMEYRNCMIIFHGERHFQGNAYGPVQVACKLPDDTDFSALSLPTGNLNRSFKFTIPRTYLYQQVSLTSPASSSSSSRASLSTPITKAEEQALPLAA